MVANDNLHLIPLRLELWRDTSLLIVRESLSDELQEFFAEHKTV
jgi:hypothetical protein